MRISNSTYLINLEEALLKKALPQSEIDKRIQYAERLLSRNLPVIFNIPHFSYLVGYRPVKILEYLFNKEKAFYKETKIPKKNGDFRNLYIPSRGLKKIQHWILKNILENLKVSINATGFCKKKSIYNNALPHIGRECIYNLDVKDFFPTIDFSKIFRIFRYYGYSKEVSLMLTKLCTFNGVLPQGSPTSPYLSNLVCNKMDIRIEKLVSTFKGNYTRYADDITISGTKKIIEYIPSIKKIMIDEGFSINVGKERIRFKGQHQVVTGLTVTNDSVKVSKKIKKELFKEIYYCKKYGVLGHLEKIKCMKSFYKEHLYGKAYFVKMIQPDLGKYFLEELNSIQWDY